MTDLSPVQSPTEASDLDHFACPRYLDRTLCGIEETFEDEYADEVACVVCTDLVISTPAHLCIIDGKECEC